MSTTIYDIARVAKVSKSTVSRVLNKQTNISDDARERVLKAIEELNYQPNKLARALTTHFFNELDKYNIPVVVIGGLKGQYKNILSVDTDNFHDSVSLTQTLIDRGFQRIACLHAPLDYHVSRDRLEGFKSALVDNGLTSEPTLIVDGGYTQNSALHAAEKLLTCSPLPEAIFATDSLKLMSLYRVAARLNIAIPQQIAVIGYSDAILSFMLTPPPSGIEVPIQALGDTSSALLFDRIANKQTPQIVVLPTESVITGSLS